MLFGIWNTEEGLQIEGLVEGKGRRGGKGGLGLTTSCLGRKRVLRVLQFVGRGLAEGSEVVGRVVESDEGGDGGGKGGNGGGDKYRASTQTSSWSICQLEAPPPVKSSAHSAEPAVPTRHSYELPRLQ